MSSKAPERARDVARDRGFFGDDELLGHEAGAWLTTIIKGQRGGYAGGSKRAPDDKEQTRASASETRMSSKILALQRTR
jgi:hypothetical protein